MKFIHTADWHFWDRHIFSVDDSRIKEIYYNAMKIIDYANENSIELIVIAGDIFHVYNPTEKVMRYFSEIVARANKMGIMIWALTGNHDTDGIHHAFESAYNLVDNDGYFSLYNEVGHNDYTFSLDGRKINFVFVPWSLNLKEELKSAKQRIVSDGINILISHFAMSGVQVSSSYRLKNLDINEKDISGWDYVALGDIHKAQQVGSVGFKKKNNAYYSGSIFRLNWGERNDIKSFNVVDISDSDISVTKKTLTDIEMLEISVDSDSSEINIDMEKANNSYIKINSTPDVKFTFLAQLKDDLIKAGAREVYLKQESKIGEYDGEDLKMGFGLEDAMNRYIDNYSGLNKKEKSELLKIGKEIIDEI